MNEHAFQVQSRTSIPICNAESRQVDIDNEASELCNDLVDQDMTRAPVSRNHMYKQNIGYTASIKLAALLLYCLPTSLPACSRVCALVASLLR